jgi:hypothetical protein
VTPRGAAPRGSWRAATPNVAQGGADFRRMVLASAPLRAVLGVSTV